MLAECVGRRSGGRGDAEVLCRLAFHCSTIMDMEGNMIILFMCCNGQHFFLSFFFFNCSVF